MPNGTDSIQDFNQYQMTHKENKNIFFLGILNVPHNIEAIMYFINDIFPHIQNKITNVHLNVLGKNPPIELINLGRNNKNITVFGYQKDLNHIIKDSSIMVAPLLSGSGVKTKIFEAMKFSIPIVATSIAAEGIIVGSKSPIIVKDDSYEFAISCIELLSDSLLRSKIGAYGPSII